MIQDWRQRWGDEFPFYFVQLAPFGPYQNSNEGSPWAELREAQTLALQLPRTGMAVTLDIGNPNDIHPTNKQDVGHRLAVNALHFDYQKTEIPYSGPLYDTLLIEGDHAVLYFKFAENGLVAKDKFGYLKGFEIAGEDRVFHFAKAEIKGSEVVVYHPKGMRPAAVRYAWADAPVDANLFNKEGFPASPFRTDEWEGVTKKVRFE
jgi:sialate O-acetylesterase